MIDQGFMTASALVPTRSLQNSSIVKKLATMFMRRLGVVQLYVWRFIPRGSVLAEYDAKPPLLAEQDYVEIHAIGGSVRLA